MITKINNSINKVSLCLGLISGRVPLFVLLFVSISLIYLGAVPNRNEEVFMQYAKQFVNPDWIYKSSILTEFPGVRLVYQSIIGSFLRFASFESAVFIFRFILIIGFSFVLSKLYRSLNMGRIQAIFHLLVFFIANQSLFAGSWMMISVEPKGFAYLFILCAFYFLLNNRFVLTLTFLIIGTYFHFLAGAYSTFYIFLTFLIFSKELGTGRRLIITFASIYFISVLPNLLYIVTAVRGAPEGLQPSADWIYTYFRSPHHTALFKSLNYFIEVHVIGVILSGLGMFFVIRLKQYFVDSKTLIIINFVICSLVGTLAAVLLAYFDTEGVFLKYYPFRINTVSTFFLMMIITKWAWDSIKSKTISTVKGLLLICILLMVLRETIPNIKKNLHHILSKDTIGEACEFIKVTSNKKAKIFSFIEDNTIMRKAERDRFVSYKLNPAELSKIHEWYFRVLEKRRAIADSQYLGHLFEKYHITYILCRKTYELFGPYHLEYSNDDFSVYTVVK